MSTVWSRLQEPSGEPLRVIIENQSASTPWLAVPLATLVAALVAGSFLTWNEHLKRKREDRRQWDKEIRDLCVEISTHTNAIVQAMWKAKSATPPIEWVDQYTQEYASTVRSDDSDHAEDHGWLQKAFIMAELCPNAKQHATEIRNCHEKLSLIARSLTIKASKSVLESAEGCISLMDDGQAPKDERRRLRLRLNEFIETVKKEIRI
jgi:hypothetical protein